MCYLARRGLDTGVTPRIALFTLPLYLWLAIFSSQPHKEERFMFVAYAPLCLNAAICYHVILTVWGSLSNRLASGKSQDLLNWTVLVAPISLTFLVSISRVLAVTSAYSAPLHVYSALPSDAHGNLCLAKEWYRFPSSYFLPAGVRAKFVSSAFDGLLPGEFPESTDSWSRPGTWMIPLGMNDGNQADPSKYV
jgi:alpha-1,2-mannosyltransferase